MYDKRPSFFWVLSLIIDITGNPFWLTHGAITVATSIRFSVACVWSQRLYWVLFCVTVLILSYTLMSWEYRELPQTKTALSKKSDALLTIETFCRVFHLFNTNNFKRGEGGATQWEVYIKHSPNSSLSKDPTPWHLKIGDPLGKSKSIGEGKLF